MADRWARRLSSDQAQIPTWPEDAPWAKSLLLSLPYPHRTVMRLKSAKSICAALDPQRENTGIKPNAEGVTVVYYYLGEFPKFS